MEDSKLQSDQASGSARVNKLVAREDIYDRVGPSDVTPSKTTSPVCQATRGLDERARN